mmetsp:Transcript_18553/g.25819  ORF Transcript_18553/g.25819 Transcript_18553/m.25819 type:complete len:269 (-) Transcript_18553:171-977(-)
MVIADLAPPHIKMGNDSLEYTLSVLWDNLFLLVPIYAVAVPYLQRMYHIDTPKEKQHKIKGLKMVMLVYNVLMSLFSFGCFAGMAWVVLVNQKGQIKVQDCGQYNRDPLFRIVVKLFHWSKYVEFLDTLFLIINYKQVSWLHYFHHCGAAINVGILQRSGIEAAWMFVSLNSFVHTIMYAYYGLSILGIKFKAKSIITSIQIIQFITGFTFFWDHKNIPCFAASGPLMGVFIYTYSYVGVVLLFFLNFFIKSYCLDGKVKNRIKSKEM